MTLIFVKNDQVETFLIVSIYSFILMWAMSMLCMKTEKLTPTLILENFWRLSLIVRYSGDWEEGVKQGQGKFTYHNGDVFTVSQDDDSLLQRSHDKKSKDDKRCHMLISTFPDDRVHMWLATAMVQESWSRQMARSASSFFFSIICHLS